jgi:hypothetical protein
MSTGRCRLNQPKLADIAVAIMLTGVRGLWTLITALT